jgi:hypothetical protein
MWPYLELDARWLITLTEAVLFEAFGCHLDIIGAIGVTAGVPRPRSSATSTMPGTAPSKSRSIAPFPARRNELTPLS